MLIRRDEFMELQKIPLEGAEQNRKSHRDNIQTKRFLSVSKWCPAQTAQACREKGKE